MANGEQKYELTQERRELGSNTAGYTVFQFWSETENFSIKDRRRFLREVGRADLAYAWNVESQEILSYLTNRQLSKLAELVFG